MDFHRHLAFNCANALLHANTAKERGAIVREYADRSNCSVATMYRRLKKVGVDSGRRRRSDAGTSRMTDEECEYLAKILVIGHNKRGQSTVSLREALKAGKAEGRVNPAVTYDIARKQMRKRGLSPEHLRAPQPSIERRSKHPNHVWLVDVSIALQWFLRDEDGKRRFTQHAHPEATFYEGKRENLANLRQVLHRYVAVDHYSGSYFVRYYYSAGENSTDLVDFLHRAMAPKEDPSTYPFQGVPRRLVVDQGSAFKSQLIRNLMAGLGVELEFHAVRNAKASGAVETRHRHWQDKFEFRMRHSRVESVQQLNRWAEQYAGDFNATCPLLRGPTRATPSDRWSRITPDQLVIAPPLEVFHQLAASSEFTRVVDPRMRISVNGEKWELSGGQLYPGAKVLVRETPLMEPGLVVQDEHGTSVAALKLEIDAAGFSTNSRLSHTWDAEDEERKGASPPTVPAQVISRELREEEEPMLFEDVFRTARGAAARQAYLNQGTPWSAPTGVETVVATFDSFEARERVIDRLGRSLTPAEGRWWVSHLGDGVSQAELDELYARFLAEVEGSATLRQLG